MIPTIAMIVGGTGLAAAILGWVLEPAAFYGGWLAAVTVLAAWPLGSIALLLVHALTGGRWGHALRPALRAGVRALPLALLATLPLTAGFSALYPWVRPDAPLANAFYLNVPFFALRGGVYTVVWLGLGRLTLRSERLSAYAPAGLFALGLTVTFAAIDATMSLDPRFTSSIHGMIAAAGMALLALSAAMLPGAGPLAPAVRADCAKLLLALTILWTYLDCMQLLIVWQSDLPHEARWYLARARGPFGALGVAIALGHCGVIGALLSPAWQRSRGVARGAAAALIALGILRAWWTVLPSLGQTVGWVHVACVAALGGLAVTLLPWAARAEAGAQAAPRWASRHV